MASTRAGAGIGTLGAVVVAITAAALLARGRRSAPPVPRTASRPQIPERGRIQEAAARRPTLPSPTVGKRVTVAAARQINRAYGLLALSVLLD
ncbi:MAG: hypothetical protein ACREFQ_16825, partial [Stellaceae bacterium]